MEVGNLCRHQHNHNHKQKQGSTSSSTSKQQQQLLLRMISIINLITLTIRVRTTPFGWDSKSRLWKYCEEQHVPVVYSFFPPHKAIWDSHLCAASLRTPWHQFFTRSFQEKLKKQQKGRNSKNLENACHNSAEKPHNRLSRSASNRNTNTTSSIHFEGLRVLLENPHGQPESPARLCLSRAKLEHWALMIFFVLWVLCHKSAVVLHDHCHLDPATSQNPPQKRQNFWESELCLTALVSGLLSSLCFKKSLCRFCSWGCCWSAIEVWGDWRESCNFAPSFPGRRLPRNCMHSQLVLGDNQKSVDFKTLTF